MPGGRVWYQIVGKGKGAPLVVLHGGPGYPHDYLEPLEDLADERSVIFYDQLGCGNSDRTNDPALWTVENFVIELQKIVQFLKLKKYHVLGQSWGAALAVAFALKKPKGLLSLILADPYISTPEWMADAKRLIKSLPKSMGKILLGKADDSEEYKNASKEYYARFVTRLDSQPEAMACMNKKANRKIYSYMWGSKEHLVSGTLKNFSQTDRLSEIKVPVLLLAGRYDGATPETLAHFNAFFPNAQSHIFEQSAHFPHWNEREEYMKVVRKFLSQRSLSSGAI